VPGCGQGGGYETYNGDTDSSTNAWTDVAFYLSAAGHLVVTGTSSTPRSLVDYGYTGANDATRNVVTYGSSAPGSPANGDLWCDTSTTPYVWKIRISGAWQLAANLSTGDLADLDQVDTPQIVDNAVTIKVAYASTSALTWFDDALGLHVGPVTIATYNKEVAGSTLLLDWNFRVYFTTFAGAGGTVEQIEVYINPYIDGTALVQYMNRNKPFLESGSNYQGHEESAAWANRGVGLSAGNHDIKFDVWAAFYDAAGSALTKRGYYSYVVTCRLTELMK
jgi:hypothetical protein